MTQIDISPISGFPEWLPDKRLAEQKMLDTIRRSYELFGFCPVETPAVERTGVLTAKGGIQRQIFSVGRPAVEEDQSADLALHFDLTVPLARYVASRNKDLTFPFRRYQMQKVWRGERAQRGRFREFYQCDIDIIGSETLDLLYDAEVARVIGVVFDALGVSGITIHLSNRKILSGLTAALRLEPSDAEAVLRHVDKASRRGPEAVGAALAAGGYDRAISDPIERLLGAEDLSAARSVLSEVGASTDGVTELQAVYDATLALGMPPAQLRIDLGIARGLDYYTGTVYETFVVGHEDWGSVCSGGRYDDLAGFFTDRRLPGVGVSIGATRLLDLLTKNGMLEVGRGTPTEVLVTVQDRASYLSQYLDLAARLRSSGIASEVYLQPRKLGDQLRYASDLRIPWVVIAGDAEIERGTVQLKDMTSGEQVEVPQDTLAAALLTRRESMQLEPR
jgi:histidyl-tRNA synthetase